MIKHDYLHVEVCYQGGFQVQGRKKGTRPSYTIKALKPDTFLTGLGESRLTWPSPDKADQMKAENKYRISYQPRELTHMHRAQYTTGLITVLCLQ